MSENPIILPKLLPKTMLVFKLQDIRYHMTTALRCYI